MTSFSPTSFPPAYSRHFDLDWPGLPSEPYLLPELFGRGEIALALLCVPCIHRRPCTGRVFPMRSNQRFQDFSISPVVHARPPCVPGKPDIVHFACVQL